MTVVQLPVAARAAAAPPRPPREAIAFQSDVTAIELRPIPLWARSTVLLIVMALAIALTWAAFARLDKVVTAQGRLVTTSPKLVVGPLEVATVRAIPVRPGDVVHKGGLLAELDPTFVAADVAMLEHKRGSLEAQLARLRAEVENGPFDRTAFGEAGRLQAAVFEQRVRERDARRVTFDREAGQVRAGLAARGEEALRLGEQLAVLKDIEGMRATLLSKRAGARLPVLEAQEKRLWLERDLAMAISAQAELREQLAGVAARRESFESEWRRAAVEEIQAAQRERDELEEQLTKARRRNTLIDLRAPVDAVVLEVADRSVGSVLQEAQPLVTLVPLQAPLEVEVQVAASDVGGLRIGDPVRIKLESFPFQKHGLLEGRVRTISEDAFISEGAQPATGQGEVFYRARIELRSTELKQVRPNLRLLPGMTLAAEIKVGDRTVLSYFLYPIIRILDESLEEI